MYANLVCSPPLSQVTTVAPGTEKVSFAVLVETAASSEKSWEVSLWHNHAQPDKWERLSLEEMDEEPHLLVVDRGNKSSLRRRWFTAELRGKPKQALSVSFTVTFRNGENESWKWANEHFSTSDGHLIYQASGSSDEDISHYIKGTSGDISISKELPDTDDTSLWSLSAPVAPASGKVSGYSSHVLGTPTWVLRWFSLVRLWSPWLAPRHGRGHFQPDKDAIQASFLREDGHHLVVLAVSGVDNVLTVLGHDGEGNIVINARNDTEKEGTARVIIAAAKSFEVANAAVMYYARKIITRYEEETGEVKAEIEAKSDNEMKPEWFEEWYDGLAYCTWNGLGQHLTESRIFDALNSLEKNEINVTNLIIDDNWQSLDHEGAGQFERGWMEFEANKQGFPRGLKQTVSEIRAKHKNIKHIAVWHALLGYWGGISPDGQIAKKYRTIEVRKRAGVAAGTMLAVSAEDVQQFYADFYSFLNSAGIDSVKTDAQFFLDELDDAPDRAALIRPYQDAWILNCLRYFSAKAISCMSQAPQIIFHSQMPTNKPRIMLRNSDDFFPEVPASHPWHVYCNAYNTLFNQHLNVLPDWDMFQTSHPWASFHAAARCVSGGPIYITDVPGAHDVNLIRQMTANTPRGDTVILRPHTIGKTISPYVGYDEPVLLKVATYVGRHGTGTPILGVFNTTTRPLTELIPVGDFPGTVPENLYLVRAHSSGAIAGPFHPTNKLALVQAELPTQSWDILTAYPVKELELQRRHDGIKGDKTIRVSNLGLLGKMTGAAAIVNSDIYVDRNSGRLRCWTSLKALGVWGLYVSDLENRSLEDDFIAVLFGREIPRHCVRRSEVPNVLEIDVARAWKESEQRAGWSNEVAIEVVIR